jgi:diaminohydroxyphosphoribosylaminopyrimidine deaminase / 5-amino-6-(5-phosphoribosylamino)uracil reductase
MGNDVFFMERAISLARSSLPFAGINPPVGAILVRNGLIIGQGFHKGPGTPHAEAAALLDARASLEQTGASLIGTTLYCSLEPCCHRGGGKRTPPCTEAIIAAGISRVVFASQDPNPCVSGKGAARLRQAGVVVEQGLLADTADQLITAFSVSIRLRRPFIRIKWAQSLDGRLACRGGASRWITNREARIQAHELRSSHDAVMVGAGTLRADDPELTVRDAPGSPELGFRQPLRIILAGREPLPMDARVFSPALADRSIVLSARSSPGLAQCRSAGIRALDVASTADGLPDLVEGMRRLYEDGIGSVLVEGGSRLITELFARGLWDAVTVFTAPVILGAGIEAVGDLGIMSPNSGVQLANARFAVQNGFTRLDGRNPKGCVEPTDVNMREKGTLSPAVVEGSCSQG